ncbi:MAG: NERD domain-containing protein [Kiritimatiellae bacterium]|nr:NERD domain-containing protein [Kiritimatiellia bacterium]
MAVVHGIAGEWSRVKGSVTGLWPVFLGVAAAGFSVAVAFFASAAWGSALFAVSVAATGAALFGALHRIESYFKGARGEERVSGILKTLPDGYHVFNDFVAMGTHVDHVVVGPPGVFSVETKNWQGEVTVDDGYVLVDGSLPTRQPVAQAVKEAALVKSALKRLGWDGDVTPVLAFASGSFRPKMAEVSGAVVMNASGLVPGFSGGRRILSDEEVERLASLMENNSR